MANYSFKTGNDLPEIPDNKTFEMCNFYQALPNTEIFVGVTGLTFVKCNLTNCTIPADTVTISCREVQYNFCTNLRPDLVDKGVPECEVECDHMVSKDVISIDDVVIDTIYEYADGRIS